MFCPINFGNLVEMGAMKILHTLIHNFVFVNKLSKLDPRSSTDNELEWSSMIGSGYVLDFRQYHNAMRDIKIIMYA